MKTMTLDDFYKKHKQIDPEDAMLDVRGQDEFSESRIEGSINIPHLAVADYADDLKKYKTVYIFCRRGARAQYAYKALEAAGLNNLVCVDDAGMEAWEERGYPYVTGD